MSRFWDYAKMSVPRTLVKLSLRRQRDRDSPGPVTSGSVIENDERPRTPFGTPLATVSPVPVPVYKKDIFDLDWDNLKEVKSYSSDLFTIKRSMNSNHACWARGDSPGRHSTVPNVPRVYEEPKCLSKREILINVIPANLKPIPKFYTAFSEIRKKLMSTNESEIIAGIRMGVRLVRFHGEYLRHKNADVNQMVMFLLVHLSSNRPLIGRASAIFFKDLFPLKLAAVEIEHHKILLPLLAKSANSHSLVSQACIAALNNAIEHLSEERARFICGEPGLKHKNVRCRAIATNLVYRFYKRVGHQKFILDHFPLLVEPLVELLLEGDSLVRKGAQNIFVRVLESTAARGAVWKNVPESLVRKTHKTLNELVDQSLMRHNKQTLQSDTPPFQDWKPEFQRRLWFS